MLYSYEFLLEIVTDIFTRSGIKKEESLIAAEVLLKSDFTGVNSHGLSRLSNYIYKINNGYINTSPQIRQLNKDENLIKLDGDNGLGLVVGPKSLDICIERAKISGFSFVTVNNSNHFGVGNYYGGKIAENNLLGITVTNATPSMAPFGGIEKLLGTNPIVVSVPAGNYSPIVLDMATSAVSYGTIEQFAIRNEELGYGWAMDKEGKMTLDPNVVLNGGMLFPLGGHKGSGLAIIIDLLCYALSGAKKSKDVVSIRARGDNLEPEGVGHMFLAIDISRFGQLDKFKEDIDEYIKEIKLSNKKESIEEIFMPGEIEYINLNKNLKHGIRLSKNIVDDLEKISREVNILSNEMTLKDLNNKYNGRK